MHNITHATEVLYRYHFDCSQVDDVMTTYQTIYHIYCTSGSKLLSLAGHNYVRLSIVINAGTIAGGSASY